MGNSPVSGPSSAGMSSRTTKAKECGPLPTLLSSNRQMDTQRELAKLQYEEEGRLNDAFGSSAALKSRVQTSNDRLAAYGGVGTAVQRSRSAKRILGAPAKKTARSW
eukprot:gnl/MRDRNA2_/MRDRNA2_78702_c0_seq1.p1 gnl/MRDRNA2_/MRDRNA2_78702_c0~~gnl/MRDRNA2_/MRDRNA2_78702_c0_seq1.p1  ORF type:complete len:107 (+),score=17.30 gnl/MRDRNA2_/MRDRNA2_78702_c0_seq1:74-394(+)